MVRHPLVPVTEQAKTQIFDMRQKGQSSSEISQALGGSPTPSQVAAIIAHGTMGTYGEGAVEALELVEAFDAKIGLERDLQRALRANIDQLERGLKIIDGGKEKIVPSGRIDIVAEDSTGTTVVIELKVGTAERDAIAQVLSYIGDISESTQKVRGIVVAGDFALPAISAARIIPQIRLLKYAHKFSFATVGT
jgi:hypothetical protein